VLYIELDADGFATCPDCGERVNCGTVGISIITKQHRGTKKCLKTKEKHDKKEKGEVQKSLLAFMRAIIGPCALRLFLQFLSWKSIHVT